MTNKTTCTNCGKTLTGNRLICLCGEQFCSVECDAEWHEKKMDKLSRIWKDVKKNDR